MGPKRSRAQQDVVLNHVGPTNFVSKNIEQIEFKVQNQSGRYFPQGSGGIPPRNCLNLTGNIAKTLIIQQILVFHENFEQIIHQKQIKINIKCDLSIQLCAVL